MSRILLVGVIVSLLFAFTMQWQNAAHWQEIADLWKDTSERRQSIIDIQQRTIKLMKETQKLQDQQIYFGFIRGGVKDCDGTKIYPMDQAEWQNWISIHCEMWK